MTSTAVDRLRHWQQQHPWKTFLLLRLTRLAVSIGVLVTLSFAMIHLVPGDPVRAALGIHAPTALVEAQRDTLGLNDPLWQQYRDFVTNALQGDFGRSVVSQLPVNGTISQRFSNTLLLAVSAFVVSLLLSLVLGVVLALTTRDGSRRRTELTFTTSTSVVGAIPEFVMAVGLVFVFAVLLRWFPVAGAAGPRSYVLPVAALALAPTAALSRIVRVEMIRVLAQDYMRTARSKRLPRRIILLRHAVPNMLTAVLTIGGMLLTGLITGSVLVETVFAWPGMGTLAVESILGKDYPMVQAIVLVMGLLVLTVNLVVDVIITVLNPLSTIRDS